MGRRRSGLSGYPLQKRIKDTARSLKLRRLKARSRLICPKCYGPFMFIAPKGKLLMLIGCKKCSLGDILPRHPTWKSLDMYNFVCDNWKDPRKIPEFRYTRMTDSVYEFLRENVTLGRIVVEIVEEDEEGGDE